MPCYCSAVRASTLIGRRNSTDPISRAAAAATQPSEWKFSFGRVPSKNAHKTKNFTSRIRSSRARRTPRRARMTHRSGTRARTHKISYPRACAHALHSTCLCRRCLAARIFLSHAQLPSFAVDILDFLTRKTKKRTSPSARKRVCVSERASELFSSHAFPLSLPQC